MTSSIPRVTRNPRLRLTWISYEDDVTFKCTVDGKTFDCGTGRDGEFTTDPLPDGKHVFKVDLVDKVGNEGEPIVVRWETGIARIMNFTRKCLCFYPSSSN